MSTGPRLVSSPASGVGIVMGAAVAVEEQTPVASTMAEQVEAPVEVASSPKPAEPIALENIQTAVLNALSGAPTLAHMLQTGEWKLEGSELVIKVAASTTIIDMSLGADAKRLAVAAATNAVGRAVKLKVISGGAAVPPSSAPRASSNGSSRSRAEQEPVIKRMQEKFGADIRTIIDYKEKR